MPRSLEAAGRRSPVGAWVVSSPVETVVGIDIGGTKLAAGVVDGAGRVVSAERVPTPRGSDAGAEVLWFAVRGLVDAVLDQAVMARAPTPVACGVGCGGPMTLGGSEVSPLNIPGWRDFPLRQRLMDHLDLPVIVDNDAKALALGEGWIGAAQESTDFLAMVVSTGVGGGIVLDGRLLDGAAGNAGHIGHVVVEPGGRICACGARGCLEAEASGTAIASITGRPPAVAPVEVRRRAGALVGRAVASVANLLDLRLAVVAGSVALGFGDDLFEPARAEADRVACLGFSRGTEIVPAAKRAWTPGASFGLTADPGAVWVSAVDRSGNQSTTVQVQW